MHVYNYTRETRRYAFLVDVVDMSDTILPVCPGGHTKGEREHARYGPLGDGEAGVQVTGEWTPIVWGRRERSIWFWELRGSCFVMPLCGWCDCYTDGRCVDACR